MPRILITAFEPYDNWEENSSWLTLVEFTKQFRRDASITTRLYPVNFALVSERLQADLAADYDYALHLGQAPGSPCVKLEAVGLNLGGRSHDRPESCQPLVADGPVAYRSTLPLAAWSQSLQQAGIPVSVSYHAGTYLCNATLYLSHYYAEKLTLRTASAFVHLPLDFSQTAKHHKELPAMAAEMSARALRVIVDQLVKPERPDGPALA